MTELKPGDYVTQEQIQRDADHWQKYGPKLLEQRDDAIKILKNYKFCVDQMNAAMKDGRNVQGAIGMLIAAEEDVEMIINKSKGEA